MARRTRHCGYTRKLSMPALGGHEENLRCGAHSDRVAGSMAARHPTEGSRVQPRALAASAHRTRRSTSPPSNGRLPAVDCQISTDSGCRRHSGLTRTPYPHGRPVLRREPRTVSISRLLCRAHDTDYWRRSLSKSRAPWTKARIRTSVGVTSYIKR